jgi:hypothetical protein
MDWAQSRVRTLQMHRQEIAYFQANWRVSACSQNIVTCPFPESVELNSHSQTQFANIHFNIIIPSVPMYTK